MIDSYRFGKIVIDGNAYTKDVIILGKEVFHPWWRKEGHRVFPEDLDWAIEHGAKAFVFGTGFYGMVKIPDETIKFLKEKGFHFRSIKTGLAVKEFNKIEEGERENTAFCLHLTC